MAKIAADNLQYTFMTMSRVDQQKMIEREFAAPNGSVWIWMKLYAERKAACNHPFLSLSDSLQEQCAQAKIQELTAKADAMAKTNGFSSFISKI